MSGPAVAPLLLAPLPAAAAATMLVNDVWAKAAFHNALTGKLSDVAWCFLLPLFLGTLVEAAGGNAHTRARGLTWAAVMTAGLFVLMKWSPGGAALVREALEAAARVVSPGLRFRVVADRSDLMALPFVLAAWAWGQRRLRHLFPVHAVRAHSQEQHP